MQIESFSGMTGARQLALQQAHSPRAAISVNSSGECRKVFSHVVENADGSRDMIITLTLGNRCCEQVIHVCAPGEHREHGGQEEVLELDSY